MSRQFVDAGLLFLLMLCQYAAIRFTFRRATTTEEAIQKVGASSLGALASIVLVPKLSGYSTWPGIWDEVPLVLAGVQVLYGISAAVLAGRRLSKENGRET